MVYLEVSKLILELLWLALLAINIIPFGFYILYMKRIAKNKPWDIKTDSNYEPDISVIIPTYNEGRTITAKLDSILEADYLKDKMEILVVDSASTDKTPNLVQRWSAEHPEVKVKLVREEERTWKVKALNCGLKHAVGQIIVTTDADCMCHRDSFRNALRYLADPTVAVVAGLHIIKARKENMSVKVEKTYRKFYRWIRIGESKLWSTYPYEGEFMAIKRKQLEAAGGFDEGIGGGDESIALKMAEDNYRAISVEDVYFIELTPYTWREKFRQKIRRGRHVFQALWKYKYLIFKKKTVFHRVVLPFEAYIYIVNPLVTVPLAIQSAAMVARYPWLLLFAFFLLIGRVREMFVTYFVDNWIMLLAMLMEIKGGERVTWQKIEEIRGLKPAQVSEGLN